jgi:isoleucyl-tRNA synthetase
VALDISITEELRAEGIARDFVNRVQNLRKDSGMDVQDKINITVAKNEDLINAALLANKDYICEETQALSLNIIDMVSSAEAVEIDEWTIHLKVTVNK